MYIALNSIQNFRLRILKSCFRNFGITAKRQIVHFYYALAQPRAKPPNGRGLKTASVADLKKIILGTPVAGHCHSAVVKSDGSARQCCLALKQSLDRKYQKPIARIVSKGSGIHAQNFVAYSLRQADSIRQGGDFSFTEFCKRNYSELFC